MAFPDSSVAAMMVRAMLEAQEKSDARNAAVALARDERHAAEALARDERHAAEALARGECHAAEALARDERHAAEVRALTERLERLSALMQPSSVASPVSASQLGLQCEQHLKELNAITLLEAAPGAAAVLTLEEQAQLSAVCALPRAQGGAEAGVVRFITPFIAALRIPQPAAGGGGGAAPAPYAPLLLVNSEEYRWLVHPAAPHGKDMRLKPDLFLTWEPFVLPRRYQEGQAVTHGLLAGTALQRAGCVAEVYEAKACPLTKEEFGALCTYHQCVPGKLKSMLFNATEFWLYQTMNGHPCRLVKCAWTTPGSASAVRAFFGEPVEPPLLQLLQRLLADLGMALLRSGPEGRCYLGSGASGHVFAVHAAADAARAPLALKVLPVCQGWVLDSEFARLTQAVERGATVVPAVPNSLRTYHHESSGDSASGGFLLCSVGEAFDFSTLGRSQQAFAALAQLHSCRIYHGDARAPNLLCVGGAARWIDLHHCRVVGEDEGAALHVSHQRIDAAVLARSVLEQKSRMVLPFPKAVLEAVEKWDFAVPETVEALGAAVWREAFRA